MSGAGVGPAGPFPGLFAGSWAPSWGAASWGSSPSGGGFMPSVSHWGGGVPGNMAMGMMPGGSFGSGWGAPVGMPGFCFPGPASVSWSPQVTCLLPGGQPVQTDGLGAVGSPGVSERPGYSAAERGSAPNAGAVAGGGTAESVHSSSLMPEVAVRGGSAQASDVSSVVGTADQGVSGVSAGVPGASTTAPSSRSYSMWIVGHSFIHWASERAGIRPGGRHLGLGHMGLRVSWWGQRGMRWSQLLVLLTDLRSRTSHPDILLIHLGGNDVDAWTGKDLVNRIKDDLRVVWDWFPGVLIVWSDIVPRPSRIASRRWTRGLAKLNRQVGKWVVGHGGWQILHDWVDVNCFGLFHTDGVHLSDVGWDLLLDDFASSCERFLSAR
uniref:Elastin-like n=1 Tax=Geotrypetes seraphini TaxID=260995 RepID=A0A6P8QLF3_GEOSA|nr:elastin-like [Geotrypetes seraphini]